MIAADLLELLRCPQTLQPLTLAEPDLLAAVNVRIAREGLTPCKEAGAGGGASLDAALVRADRTVLYPVCDGIPVLLAESAILL